MTSALDTDQHTQPRRRHREDLLGSVFIPLVAAVIAVSIWASYVGTSHNLASWLGYCVCLLCLFQLTALVRTQTGAFMQYGFWAFVFAWVGFAPLIQVHYNRFPWPDVPFNQLFVPAQLLLVGACGAYFFGSRSATPKERNVGRVEHRGHSETPLERSWVPLVALAIVAPYALHASGGISSRFTSRYAFSQRLQMAGISQATGGSIQIALIQLLPAAATAVLAFCASSNISRQYYATRSVRPGSLVVGLIALAALLTFANPLASSRFLFFSVVLSAVYGTYQIRTARSHAVLAGLQLLGLLAIYPLSSWFKLGGRAFAGYNDGAAINVGTKSFLGVDFDGFQQTANSVFYVRHSGFGFGHFTVSALGFWIPRALWSGKALPASIPVAASRDYVFQNLSLPLWTEFFVDFSVPGMLLLMFMYGRVSARLDNCVIANPGSVTARVAAIVGAGQIGFLRGPMGAQIPFFATALVLGLFALKRFDVGEAPALRLQSNITRSRQISRFPRHGLKRK